MKNDGTTKKKVDLAVEKGLDWTRKYSLELREIVFGYGTNDRGIPALVSFNRAVIEVWRECQGGSEDELIEELHRLREDWDDVLQGTGSDNAVFRFHPWRDYSYGYYVEAAEILNPTLQDYEKYGSTVIGHPHAADYLFKKTGIKFDTELLWRLHSSGRGPNTLRAEGWDYLWRKEDLDRWLNYVFGSPDAQPEPYYPVPSKSVDEKPAWLLVGPCSPDTEYLRDHLVAWRAEVLGPVDLALQAALIASRENLAAAIIISDWNIEAAMVITGILLRRRVPYVVVTAQKGLPDALDRGGVVLEYSIDEIRHALETRLPSQAIAGMDFTIEAKIEWGGTSHQ